MRSVMPPASAEIFKQYDAILTPSAPGVAPQGHGHRQSGIQFALDVDRLAGGDVAAVERRGRHADRRATRRRDRRRRAAAAHRELAGRPARLITPAAKKKGGPRAALCIRFDRTLIIPPIPPMPPPAGIAGAGSFGSSATIASVVMRRPATEAASCSAVRTTLAGSMMPASTMSTYSSVWASKPKVSDFFVDDLADHDRAFDAGVLGDLADRSLERLEHDVDAGLHVGVVVGQLADRLLGAQQRDAAARHDAFLDRRAGGVERVLDAVLLLLHFDLGRAADRITATPPASLASRSCSFSRS